MRLTEAELLNFAKSIPDKCRRERSIILMAGQGKWDTHVRKSFAEYIEGWFRQHFDLSTVESKRYVYAEGWNPIPTKLRGSAFFGTKMHPDAALDDALLEDQLRGSLLRVVQLLRWRTAIEGDGPQTPDGELLRAALQDKERSALERA